jgi:hypothetical protein
MVFVLALLVTFLIALGLFSRIGGVSAPEFVALFTMVLITLGVAVWQVEKGASHQE